MNQTADFASGLAGQENVLYSSVSGPILLGLRASDIYCCLGFILLVLSELSSSSEAMISSSFSLTSYRRYSLQGIVGELVPSLAGNLSSTMPVVGLIKN